MRLLELILDAMVMACHRGLKPTKVRMSRATYDRLSLYFRKLNLVSHINFIIQHKVYGMGIVVVPVMDGVSVE